MSSALSWITGTADEITGPVFGRKPNVPPIEQLDLSEEQKKAIAANIAAAPEAQQLAGLTADEIDRLIQREFPGIGEASGQISKNINSYLKGEIPADVQQLIHRSDAAKAISGGYGGTGMQDALVARDLGLTSLDLTKKGTSMAEDWLAASERLYSPAMNVFTGMFVTPEQQARFDVEERNTQFQRSWLNEQIAAMPDPAARGIFDTIVGAVYAYLGASYQPYKPNYNTTPVGNQGYDQSPTPGAWDSSYTPEDPNYGKGPLDPSGTQPPPPDNSGGGGGNSKMMGAMMASFI